MAASSSSSVEELDMATESDTESSTFAGGAALSWRVAEKITSTLTQAELKALCLRYNVPDVYTPYSAGEKPACTVEDKAISIYADAFDAGMRLPLHDFYAEVLRHYGFAPSQLAPNAWSYMAAFVLICADAGVEPMLQVFRSFTILTHKGELHHFRPHFQNNHPPLFRSGMPLSRHGWKSRFFFLRATTPWPCPVKWGKPSKAAICKPTLTTPEKTAMQKLLDKVASLGKEGIDVMRFVSERTLPVGHHVILTPQHHLSAVKEEATVITGTMEQSKKRKSPESSTPLPQQSQSGVETSTPLGSAHAGAGLPNVSGSEHSAATQGLVDSMAGMFKQVKMAVDELAGKEKKLQESKEEITQLKLELQVARDGPAQLREELRLAKEALVKANTAHSVELGRLSKELQQVKDELRAVKIDCQHKLISMEHTRYVKGLMDMRQLAMDVYPEVVNSSDLKHPLLDGDQLTSAPKVPAEIK